LDVSLEVDPIWIERSFGQLEGLLLDEIDHIQPPIDYYHPYLAIGATGESQTDLYLRASQAIQSLLRRPPGCYLIVSHGAMLNKVFYAIFGITPAGHYNSPVFPLGNMAFASISYNPEARQWLFHSLVNQPVDHPVYSKFTKE
jgi:2,3-bisphosphoglycerate-dependent phosphoglycerate mutase